MAASAQILPFPAPEQRDDPRMKELSALRSQFQSAIGAKVNENAEAAEADRYYHAVQWTAAEIKVLKARNQPPIVFNRIKRKINTTVGILERMRGDPKGYPRNPQQQAEDGAELATKTLNYALGWDWTNLVSTVARRCCIRGIAGAEMVVSQGDQGDPDIEWLEVDQRDFFYDDRSTKWDFSDAAYMGTTRMMDMDVALVTWPDHEAELQDYTENSRDVMLDRGDERPDLKWYDRKRKQLRICDHWYRVGKTWFYAVYCGSTVLEEGPSPHKDEKGRSAHKYEMCSYEVDHENDRYGMYRDLKGPQDEINHRRSKGIHNLNNRRVIATKGAVDDVDRARREYARNDGWVEINPGGTITPDDQAKAGELTGQLEFLKEAKQEIDTYGPNPQLIGTNVDLASGRAIQLLQSAGIAELGTFVVAFKHWRLRCYRKTWCAIQQFWTAPRWIRVSDDPELEQFVQVNGWQQDPQTGFPTVINRLAALDVDILLDEGPDSINTMADTFDLMTAMASKGLQVPPEVLIELSPLPGSTKKKVMALLEKQQQGNPMEAQAIQLKLQEVTSKIDNIVADSQLKRAKAQEALQPKPGGGPGQQIDTPADLAKAGLDVAKAEEIRHKIAIGAHYPGEPTPPPPQPGLFEVNQAKAQEHLARADLASVQAAKTGLEAKTILEAPPGMLTRPIPDANPR